MKYVNFGNSGVKVSRIALGLGLRGEHDAAEAERFIKSTIDMGVILLIAPTCMVYSMYA